MADMSTPTRAPRTNASRRRAAAVRAWAVDNGFTVAEGGRIPAAVTAAYEAWEAGAEPVPNGPGPGAAEPGPQDDGSGPGESGPDWGDGDQGDDEGDTLSPFGPGGTASPPQDGPESDQAAEPGLPPPASLAEARERAQGDQGAGSGRKKRPGWATFAEKADRAARPVEPVVKITKAVREDIAGKLTLMLTFPLMAWETVDPYCGGAASARLDRMVQTAVPLICQSPDAVKLFTKGTTYVLWLEFISAVMPVGAAVYQHHIAHTVELVPADQAEAAEADQAGADPGQQYPPVFTGHIPVPRP
jgi:hypothetical protein